MKTIPEGSRKEGKLDNASARDILDPHEPLPYIVVGVRGFIGAGKTELLKQAKNTDGICVFKENVPATMLHDYISESEPEETMNAYIFQLPLMMAACTRQHDALSAAQTLSETGFLVEARIKDKAGMLRRDILTNRVVLVERPPLENRIFALANYLSGKMDRRRYGKYLDYIAPMIEEANVSEVPQHSVYLWSSPGITHANMIRRGNESERSYDTNNYLACLHHCYFLDFVVGHLQGFSHTTTTVLDWRNYGTYSDVRASMAHDTANPISIRLLDEDISESALTSEKLAPLLPRPLSHCSIQCVNLTEDGDDHDDCVRISLQCGFIFLDLEQYMNATKERRFVVQEAVMSHLARLPEAVSENRTRVCHTLVVSNVNLEALLYNPDSLYAQDSTYQ